VAVLTEKDYVPKALARVGLNVDQTYS